MQRSTNVAKGGYSKVLRRSYERVKRAIGFAIEAKWKAMADSRFVPARDQR